jgi:hypothetical protein
MLQILECGSEKSINIVEIWTPVVREMYKTVDMKWWNKSLMKTPKELHTQLGLRMILKTCGMAPSKVSTRLPFHETFQVELRTV